ncbi:hypothetical protein B0H14DRAFT_2624263 [Mycena olivaceomarginata]|nr:hypothetical protein B0H14DRAFT_2624263 [Mycena olivaceomarginata]
MKSENAKRIQPFNVGGIFPVVLPISRWHSAGLLDNGGYLNSQTSDTQYFGFMESQAAGLRPVVLEPLEDQDEGDGIDESGSGFGSMFGVSQANDIPPVVLTPADFLLESYANSAPGGTQFPILEKLGTLVILHRPLSRGFCFRLPTVAMSGNRDPLRQPNALEIELAAVLTRIAQSVPLIARLSMDGRWNDTMAVVEDARRNLSLLDLAHCIGRIVEDEVNPELTSQDVTARNYTREWKQGPEYQASERGVTMNMNDTSKTSVCRMVNQLTTRRRRKRMPPARVACAVRYTDCSDGSRVEKMWVHCGGNYDQTMAAPHH